MNRYIQVKNLSKSYEKGKIKALRGASLKVRKGEFLAIMGPSGCGKTTLLNMIGALDQPDQGEIFIDSQRLENIRDLSSFRSQKIGYIFQLHNLIPTLTAEENVQIPMFEKRLSRRERTIKAKKLLDSVDLKSRSQQLPTKLSGGERQRVAVARALANDPEILIADEPTGSLDSQSAKDILDLIKRIHQEKNQTVVMVTHEKQVASYGDRIIQMIDGQIKG